MGCIILHVQERYNHTTFIVQYHFREYYKKRSEEITKINKKKKIKKFAKKSHQKKITTNLYIIRKKKKSKNRIKNHTQKKSHKSHFLEYFFHTPSVKKQRTK